MKITINQITPRRQDGAITSVEVHFSARTNDGNINLNGSLPVEGTSLIDFAGIEDAVKQEVVDKIMNGEVSTE